MRRVLTVIAVVITTSLPVACGGGDGGNDLTEDEQERVGEARETFICQGTGFGTVDPSEREAAAQDLADIYREKPDASWKNPTQKDAEPLEDILRESEETLDGCNVLTDPDALAASAELNEARVEVARDD